MRQKPSKPDSITGYAAKRDMLLKLLPVYGFVTAKAARAAGYKDSYIRSGLHTTLAKDAWFCSERDRLKAEYIGLEADEVAAADEKLKNLINRGELTPALLLKALELFYRRKGALQDKTVIESAERERELSDAARVEARKLAVHLMSQSTTKQAPKAG
jgi:hypothetical protein